MLIEDKIAELIRHSCCKIEKYLDPPPPPRLLHHCHKNQLPVPFHTSSLSIHFFNTDLRFILT